MISTVIGSCDWDGGSFLPFISVDEWKDPDFIARGILYHTSDKLEPKKPVSNDSQSPIQIHADMPCSGPAPVDCVPSVHNRRQFRAKDLCVAGR